MRQFRAMSKLKKLAPKVRKTTNFSYYCRESIRRGN
ncbi:unnamed protein product [Brassica napus]|uniref:(rape) hypothetical protein n=1 Tax=Brassica napus TaxID=3708 RepID=A0A816VYC5_BRANA|nr:unnamed protein product [Brassica napus]